MDLSSDDLEDCMEKFRNTFLNHKNNKRDEEDLLMLVERLAEDLKCSRENEQVSRECLLRLLESKKPNITEKYVTLDGKYRELEVEKLKLEDQKNEYERHMNDEVERHNLEIDILRKQMESDKICYEVKESEFQNQLQAAQAAADLRCDDIESNLQRKLVDTNSKLRQAQNTIKSLQLENNSLKMQLIQQKYSYTPRNNTLYFQESPVQPNRNNLPPQQPTTNSFGTHPAYGFVHNDSRSSSAYSASSRMTEIVHEPSSDLAQKNAPATETQRGYTEDQEGSKTKPQNPKSGPTEACSSAKYPPLPIDHFAFSEDDVGGENMAQKFNQRPAVVHKGARQSVLKTKSAKGSFPTSNKTGNGRPKGGRCSSDENQPRKRKLYNPDDLEYLQSLMEPDD